MKIDFQNKTILITGASTGIGKSLAVEFARENCKLILLSRRIEFLNELKNSLKTSKAEIEVYKCDVSKKSEVKTTFEKITSTNFIDVALLNAGVDFNVKIANYDSNLAEEIFNVNVLGIIYCVEQLLPEFIKKGKGIIAGVSSLADNRGYSGSGFYCASKAAATIYLEGLRLELKKFGIKVITIKPGFVKTPMTDKNKFRMPLLMSPEKAALIIKKGISKGKRIVQFPFPTVVSSRLIGMLPSSFYELIAEKFRPM